MTTIERRRNSLRAPAAIFAVATLLRADRHRQETLCAVIGWPAELDELPPLQFGHAVIAHADGSLSVADLADYVDAVLLPLNGVEAAALHDLVDAAMLMRLDYLALDDARRSEARAYVAGLRRGRLDMAAALTPNR